MSELLVSASEHQSRLCQNLQDLPLGRTAWNRLLKASETRSVFLTWQWLATWWECFGTGSELYTLAVLRDEELVGIAPLMLRREEGRRVLEFLGAGTSDVADVIAAADEKPHVLATVFEALLRRRDRWDVLHLSPLPAASSTLSLLQDLQLPEGWEVHNRSVGHSSVLSIEKSRFFAESCAHKRSLVRPTRYFERLAPLEFRHVLDADELGDLLPHFFEQHRDRRFMAGDRSLFDDVRHRRFFERVARALLDTEWLRFAVLRWRDELLAFHFGFYYDGVFTWYVPSFNVDYARYSPGQVMLKKLLESALATETREFDLALGDSAHKDRFANLKRECRSVEILQSRGLEAATPEPTPPPGQPPAPRAPRRLRLGRRHWLLWRVAPLPAVASEFRVQWARYSQIKSIVRQEGMKAETLIASLARMRRGEHAVVVLWQERPVTLLWLARDPAQAVAKAGFAISLPEGAAFTTESHLVSDVQGSPRRETLMPAVQTFLAAQGVTSLFGISAPGGPEPLPVRCGGQVELVARRTEVGLLVGRFSYQQRSRQA